MGGFGGGGEDVGEEEVAYATLQIIYQFEVSQFIEMLVLTVASMPTSTTTKFTLCWVVRTAFSPGERSDHLT